MLIYVTGVAGSGKSTLRDELDAQGYRAKDADDGFCAWFGVDGRAVATPPLEERTPDWYASHRWQLLPEPVRAMSEECSSGLGFLVGAAANAEALSAHFGAAFYLTADTNVILERLLARDGAAHGTRFAAYTSVRKWQQSAERWWADHGYTPLDSTGTPVEVADRLLQVVAAA